MTESSYTPAGPGAPLTGAQVQAMIDASTAPLQAQITALQGMLNQYGQGQAAIAQLQTDVITLGNKDTAQDVSIGTNTSAISANTSAIGTNTSAIDGLSDDVDVVEADITAIETKNTQQDTSIGSLETRMTTLEGRVTALETPQAP